MGDINAPEYKNSKALFDFIVSVKKAESMFIETNVTLNKEGQLLLDYNSFKQMYSLNYAIIKHLKSKEWKVNGKEVFMYTDERKKRTILTPYDIMPYVESKK
ncbi:hypothetical protein [Cytobacillus sp. IB215316]|uniref:hypothetical protein n=1 Tax=Cytobacillus sp. IB215316 TaxID=3097354 RepID=UPI002A155AD7|nr:hypothetical protein [Cytobacillus sp. IB215316]MDX8360418.1 hypothetical protein [Cytobacillus sp. IB215316]